MKKKLDIGKRFLQLAYNQLNPSLSTVEGLEQVLTNWYMFQYNVPHNDDKMLSMTLEELLVLRQMHNLRENPHLADQINSDADSYEDWLKKEMGEDYVNPDDMIAAAEKLEAEEIEAAKKLPEVITTDFTNSDVE